MQPTWVVDLGMWCWMFLGTQVGRTIGAVYALRLVMQAIAKLFGDDLKSLAVAKDAHRKLLDASEARFERLWRAGRRRRFLSCATIAIGGINLGLWGWTANLPVDERGKLLSVTASDGAWLIVTLFTGVGVLALDVWSAWQDGKVSELKRLS